MEENLRTVDPNQKRKQNARRFLNYCRTSRYTPSWCCRKIPDQELKQEVPRKKSCLLRTTTKNEDQTMDQNNGLETKISKNETRTTLTMYLRENPPQLMKVSLPDQTSNFVNRNNSSKNDERPKQSFNRSDRHRSQNGTFSNLNGNWRNNGSFLRSSSPQRRDGLDWINFPLRCWLRRTQILNMEHLRVKERHKSYWWTT